MAREIITIDSNQYRRVPNLPPSAEPNSIFLVGEAPGAEEEIYGEPFVGASGMLLKSMLAEVGIDYNSCYKANVFTIRPPDNDIGFFCSEHNHGLLPLPLTKTKTRKSLYVKPEHLYMVEALYEQLKAARPNIIIPLGNTALAALGEPLGISIVRGTVVANKYGKLLPTYHPAAVLRDWSMRLTSVCDLRKAKIESTAPDIKVPNQTIWLDPTPEELLEFEAKYIDPIRGTGSPLAFDIETKSKSITCIGFAATIDAALVIPIVSEARGLTTMSDIMAQSPETFLAVIAWIKRILEDPSIVKLGQNGVYDMQWLAKFNIFVRNYSEDTMILAHAISPEMKKGLAFLGSIFTSHPSWKWMKPKGKGTEKKDD